MGNWVVWDAAGLPALSAVCLADTVNGKVSVDTVGSSNSCHAKPIG